MLSKNKLWSVPFFFGAICTSTFRKWYLIPPFLMAVSYSHLSYSGKWVYWTTMCNSFPGFDSHLHSCSNFSTDVNKESIACKVLDAGPDPTDGTCNWSPDPPTAPRSHFYYLEVEIGEDNNHGGDCSNNTNNPINIPTGNKYYKVVDYKDNDFELSRSYNSAGGSWMFSYRQTLNLSTSASPNLGYLYPGSGREPVESDGDIVLSDPYRYAYRSNAKKAVRADGKILTFAISDGNYIASSQVTERLSLVNNVYKLESVDNRVESYNLEGNLIAIEKMGQQPISISYENAGQEIFVTKGNQQIRLTNDSNYNIVEANFPDGSSASYSYSGENNLLSHVVYLNASGNNVSEVRYLYEDTRFPTYITGIVDAYGNRISSVQYDDQGRAISSEKGPLNSGIERTQIQYNADGTRTLTNALGKQSTYHFTQYNGEYKMTQVEGHPSANCAGANKNYTYDTNGFMDSKTDWANNVTTYIHNDRGQETSRTEASGTPQARTIATEWHAEFNLPTLIIEPERETVMTYDPNGRLLSRQVQPRSN